MHIIREFRNQADANPSKIAIYCDSQTITYKELDIKVNQLVHYMIKNGIKREDKIGVVLHNNIFFIELILAAANIGAALVPVSPQLPVETIHKSFLSTDVKHIVAEHNYYKKAGNEINDFKGQKISADYSISGTQAYTEHIENMPTDRITDDSVTGDEILILTLTSGSTGNPKPIILTQNNKYKRAKSAIRLYGITKDDVVLAATPLYHSLAERLVIMPLIIGARSVIMQGFTPLLWLNEVKSKSVTFTIAVSSQLNRIAELLSSPYLPEIDSLRCVVSSSASLQTHIKKELLSKLKCDIYECYGTSEIAVASNLNLKDSKDKLKSVGKPIEEADIKIINDKGEQVSVNESGEIICKTSLLFSGYYKQEELTNKAMMENYFRTGDVGYLDEDGYLYFLGRFSDTIITGGINVYASDIEDVLMKLDSVKECAAFPYPDQALGEIVAVAVVTGEKGFNKREAAFLCAKKLADFQQPRKYFEIDSLPRNSMGKLMKHKLIEKFQEINDGGIIGDNK